MSLLTDGLPTAVRVRGTVHAVRADYQTALRILTAFEDRELTQAEKYAVLIGLLYKQPPGDFQEAVRQGIRFLDCGKDEGGISGISGPRMYSWTHDARFIYSAVDRVLRGRLSAGGFLHWWEFATAFMELPEDCFMSRLIYLRAQYTKGKLTREERRLYAELREYVVLPVEYSEEEQQAKEDFLRKLGNA